MNFLREFKTKNDYLSVKDNFEYPTVSYVQETDLVYFMEKTLYEFVDLGLPSGTKWASCNVGAEKPEDFGLYFAWGETEGYSGITAEKGFYWGDYKYSSGQTSSTSTSFKGVTKYNNKSTSGTVDNLTVLEQVDDAAYVSDNTCRMPTREDCQELIDNTTSTWEKLNGIKGRRFTSKTNGNSIFVPAAGLCLGGNVDGVGSRCDLWSNFLYYSPSNPIPWNSATLYFNSDYASVTAIAREAGVSIRAVKE